MGGKLIGSVGLASSGVPDDLLTTKGDTHGFSSTNARIPIGDDDAVLTADSGEALGLKWSAPAGGGSIAKVDEQTASGGEGELTGTFTAIDLQTNACAMIIWKGAQSADADLMLRWNGIDTAGSYSGNAMYMGSGSSSLVTHSSQDHMPLTYKSTSPASSPDLGFAGIMYLYSYENPAGADVIMGSYLTNNFDGWQIWQCQNSTTSQTQLDEFRLYSSTNDALIAGTQYTVYKITQ